MKNSLVVMITADQFLPIGLFPTRGKDQITNDMCTALILKQASGLYL